MLVVVGGHSRNIGKTSVVEGIIRALPGAEWTAIKVTQHGHGICADMGEACGCETEYDHPYAITEETAPSATDSGRFLAAGARRAYWARTPMGHLGEAVPELRRILGESRNAIIESNSLLQFFVPDLFVVVLDLGVVDMKDSTRRYLDRADAFVVTGAAEAEETVPWAGVPVRWFEGKRVFHGNAERWVSDELKEFIEARLGAAVNAG